MDGRRKAQAVIQLAVLLLLEGLAFVAVTALVIWFLLG
jgi:hypothetical protein